MTAEELQAALDRGAWSSPASATPANPARPVSESIGCSDDDALTMARAKGLIDGGNVLHCWNCSEACDWHVSLHCTTCRLESIRKEPERRGEAYRLERERRQREQDQSRPQQRVANRSFRDGY